MEGSLTAEVLSAYDLPYPEAPQFVSLTVNTFMMRTGPPLARHKNRNSFRFSAPGSNTASSSATDGSSSTIKIVAPLRALYPAKATIRVMYANQEPLEATYELNQLKIHESKWLILNLNPTNSLTVSTTTEEDEMIPPTIRIKVTLNGPYRPEIKSLVDAACAWFDIMDNLEAKTQELLSKTPKLLPLDPSQLALPAVPVLASIVVAAPVVAGLSMVFLPFLLPVILVVIGIVVAGILTCGALYFSTRVGRYHLGGLLAPIMEHFLSSRAGQTLCYDTGPRPTPVSVARTVLPTTLWPKLAVSLLIDLIGSSSYLLPVLGEALDLGWAPIQTVLIMAMYDSTSPNLKYVSFFEEILPFTDIVPSASIGFLAEYVPKSLQEHAPEVAQMVDSLVPARNGVAPKRD